MVKVASILQENVRIVIPLVLYVSVPTLISVRVVHQDSISLILNVYQDVPMDNSKIIVIV